jgi:hypothetical protein
MASLCEIRSSRYFQKLNSNFRHVDAKESIGSQARTLLTDRFWSEIFRFITRSLTSSSA